MCEEYNGWTNRETWAVALYINNDQGWQESVHEALRSGPYASEGFTLAEARQAFFNAPRSIERYAGEIIRANVEEGLHEWYMGIVADGGAHGDRRDQYESVRDDLGSLWRVDWDELGANFLSALDES